MARVSSYKDLIVYKKAYSLCLSIYKSTKEFPREEVYGLVSQMRRCAVSIPSNIAEGYRRKLRKEYIHFLRIAFGSCAELETQICLSRDLNYLNHGIANTMLLESGEVSRMLNKLISSLEELGTDSRTGIERSGGRNRK